MKKLIVILAVIAMVGAFTATTMAAEWNLYGSARMATFWVSDDPGGVGSSSSDNLNWDLQGNSRIGANVKFNDSIAGRFEYGSGPNLRLLYGTYNFDGGQILIGQQYAPSTSFYSDSVYDGDGDLLGVGQFYIGRVPMIQLSMAGFKVALIKPSTFTSIVAPIYDPVAMTYSYLPSGRVTTDTEVKLPKIEVSYAYKTDQFFVDVFAGYQTFDQKFDDGVDVCFDDSVDSWVAGIGGGVNFGAMYLKAGVHISQNQGQYGAYNPVGMFDEAVYDGAKMVDNDGFGYLVVLGFKASDSVNIEAGYGSETNELDGAYHEDETIQYYANLTYTITPGFFVVPEIGMIDRKNDVMGDDAGDITYGGIKWQINF
jgi:hypothetical protein